MDMSPEDDTVAIVLSEDFHVTSVVFNVFEDPSLIVHLTDDIWNISPNCTFPCGPPDTVSDTGTAGEGTVTLAEALVPFHDTLTVALPPEIPVSNPFCTLTTDSSEDVHIPCDVMVSDAMVLPLRMVKPVAFICLLPPMATEVGVNEME